VNSQLSRVLHSLQRNILRGVITAGPFFITWLVFTFILGVLANPACRSSTSWPCHSPPKAG